MGIKYDIGANLDRIIVERARARRNHARFIIFLLCIIAFCAAILAFKCS